jgi:hypothetical protein
MAISNSAAERLTQATGMASVALPLRKSCTPEAPSSPSCATDSDS